jgi:two-component system, NtrC family, response regulator AtoC
MRNPETRSFVRMVMDGDGHKLIEAAGWVQAQSLLSNGLDPDLVLIESTPAGPSETLEFRQFLRNAPKHCTCLIMGIGDQTLRKEASEIGIKYLLTLPLTRRDIETMITEATTREPLTSDLRHLALQNPRADHALSAETAPLEGSPADMTPALLLEELGGNHFFLAASPKMLDIHRKVKLLAEIDASVLILGESGTGKEVIAQLIHKHSLRSRNKFLKVNCAALPSDLLESELFGHQQGAFTGALKDRPGRFEQANRGTLLLDEIGEMSAQMQAKLLHVLQDGEFTRLGAQQSTKVDVRVLAATNVQMESALLDKSFREDLYYRLNAFTIHVPPLRERREEIPYLIEETIRRAPAEMKRRGECGFSSRLLDVALLHEWRGNVRELRNFVTRTLVMGDLDAAVRELETKIAAVGEAADRESSDTALSSGQGMRSVVRGLQNQTEVQMIRNALEVSGWNRRNAAKQLNISYRTLLYKIQQYRLSSTLATEG